MAYSKVDHEALAYAASAVGLDEAVARELVTAYLHGQRNRRQRPNDMIRRLAAMAVGQSFVLEYKGRKPPKLQTTDRERARVLMNEPRAQWKGKTINGWGLKVTRTA